MLLSAELNLVMSAIDLLLGGGGGSEGGAAQRERRLTDIDWALARHFLDRLIAQLSIVWSDVTDVELAIGPLDMHMETAQTAPVSEPTLALTMEARMEGDSATLALLLPYSAIATVAHRFSSRDDVVDGRRRARGDRRARGRRQGRDDRARRGGRRRPADRGGARAAARATCSGSTRAPPTA